MEAHRLFLACRLPARRLAFAGSAGAFALLLSGCDVDRVSALEERMAAVEAKAEAAEKKAKAAESLAATNQPQAVSQPEPVMQNDDNPDGDPPVVLIEDGGDPPPPPPMADNGNG